MNKHIKKIDFHLFFLPTKNDISKNKIEISYQIRIDVYTKDGKEYKDIPIMWDEYKLIPIISIFRICDKGVEIGTSQREMLDEIQDILKEEVPKIFDLYFKAININHDIYPYLDDEYRKEKSSEWLKNIGDKNGN